MDYNEIFEKMTGEQLWRSIKMLRELQGYGYNVSDKLFHSEKEEEERDREKWDEENKKYNVMQDFPKI